MCKAAQADVNKSRKRVSGALGGGCMGGRGIAISVCEQRLIELLTRCQWSEIKKKSVHFIHLGTTR